MPKKVLAFGTFDVLHPGHEFFLKKARALGDTLVVVIARDSNVEKIKGKPAAQGEQERLKAVHALQFVDEAVLGDEPLSFSVVERQKPDIIALGYDQNADEKKLRELGFEVARLPAFKPSKFKSSKLTKMGG